ncbi:hypothetical protein FACS1894132_09760 [Clostridia bacterium]|nr:hypothetical protein FACS1894132_09760 [Clostridia bacterium]
MGLFPKIFNKKTEEISKKISSNFQFLNGGNTIFTPSDNRIYNTAEIRSAIHAFANAACKIQLEVKGSAREDLKFKLKYSPNEFMDLPKFIYVTATILSVNNTVFIVPVDDLSGRITGYYPISPNFCEVVEIDKKVYIKYQFGNGKRVAIPYERIGIITDYQFSDSFFGEDNQPLKSLIDIINAQEQGLVNGIKNSAGIRFLAKLGIVSSYKEPKQPDDSKAPRKKNYIDELRENVNKINFEAKNNGGVAIFDNSFDSVIPIKSEPFVVNAPLMKTVSDTVFKYFGVPENIIRGDFTDTQYTAFFENKLEPFFIKLCSALNGMTFSQRERQAGNEIIYVKNILDFAAAQTKLEFATTGIDRGFLTLNEAREILGLSPIDGGDERVRRLDYCIVSGGDKFE